MDNKTWGKQKYLQNDTIILVLCSTLYDKVDYIDDYNDFLELAEKVSQMKIIFVNTLYPEMLHAIFKDINPSDLSYDELLTLINESLCGDSNFYSKNISMYGCNADDIYVNNNLLDKKWENKFKDIRSIPTFFKQIEYYKPDFIYFQNIN